MSSSLPSAEAAVHGKPDRPAQRLLHLDVIRGVAILMVLCTHTPIPVQSGWAVIDWPFAALARIGWAGVDLFFVLSGFLIGGLLFREYQRSGSIDVKRFWIRRWFKIWPAYLVFIVVYIVFISWYTRGAAPFVTQLVDTLGNLWPNLLHIQNYFASTKEVAWTWSLAVEEHFYLALPLVLVLLLCRRPLPARSAMNRIGLTCLGCVVLCLILRAITFHYYQENPGGEKSYVLRHPTHLYMDSLFVGVFLAYLTLFNQAAIESLRRYRYLFLLGSVGLFFLPALWNESPELFLYPFGNCVLWSAAVMGILFAHFMGTTPVQARGWIWATTGSLIRFIAWIGVYSYSIYLWHGYFGPGISNQLMRKMGIHYENGGWESVVQAFTYFVVCILLGVCTSFLIEIPALRFRDRFFPSRGSQPLARGSAAADREKGSGETKQIKG